MKGFHPSPIAVLRVNPFEKTYKASGEALEHKQVDSVAPQSSEFQKYPVIQKGGNIYW